MTWVKYPSVFAVYTTEMLCKN